MQMNRRPEIVLPVPFHLMESPQVSQLVGRNDWTISSDQTHTLCKWKPVILIRPYVYRPEVNLQIVRRTSSITYTMTPSSPCYLVDFSVYKPPEELRVNYWETEKASRQWKVRS